jgi:hypothetical protein
MAIQNRFFHEILLGLFNPIMPEMKAAIMNLGLGPRQKDYYSSRLPMKAERCVFRAIPASHSDGSRPPIPSEGGQPFRREGGHFLAGIGMGGRNASE